MTEITDILDKLPEGTSGPIVMILFLAALYKDKVMSAFAAVWTFTVQTLNGNRKERLEAARAAAKAASTMVPMSVVDDYSQHRSDLSRMIQTLMLQNEKLETENRRLIERVHRLEMEVARLSTLRAQRQEEEEKTRIEDETNKMLESYVSDAVNRVGRDD
jgi:predicted RNase H-like nuclease (RuvC/YqgF family)